MTATKSPTDEYIVLHGVPREVYLGILGALGECHLRHTYDRGSLEMRRVLYGVAWDSYLKFLDATGEFNLRHTYEPVERSIAFPFLKPADLMRFVRRRAEIGKNGVVREFVQWAQRQEK